MDGGPAERGRAGSGAGLRRFVRPPRAAGGGTGTDCGLCAAPCGERHGHVVDLTGRALLCACQGCHLLLDRAAAAAGRYRAVPERHLALPEFRVDPADWEEMQIPVRTAFFFHNSTLGRYVAFYPSPGGATECLLPLRSFDRILAANAGAVPGDVLPDVEAFLVDRGPGGPRCHLVPIDACYRLAGLVRLHWKGFDGGPDVWKAIDGFFTDLGDGGTGGPARPGGRPAGEPAAQAAPAAVAPAPAAAARTGPAVTATCRAGGGGG
ncbi:DUF5947 family protein [Sphaerisporangium rufum]|uniref:DUF5947 family protein n=1 Tax=Sphaerisporangium rufum TaxID=1381558 RepID=UPI00194DB5A9|nr:DUF5947 family protein [Sphaerisporangium rufum]